MVIDPFAGTASTGVAALRLGSYFIGADIDTDIVVFSALTAIRIHTFPFLINSCIGTGAR